MKYRAPLGKYMDKVAAASLDETKPCPGGTYGSALGLKLALCSGDCVEGYYCPPGSTNNKTKQCGIEAANLGAGPGDAAVYCPPKSATPLPVTPGYYSIPVTSDPFSALTRTGQTTCPVGYYCKNGIQTRCGEGKPLPSRWYCPTTGMSEPTAMYPGFYGAASVGVPKNETLTLANECEAGYFCANGRKDECGGHGLYCPAKVSSPLPVRSGFYSTGGVGGSDSVNTKNGEAECPAGSYCKGGERFNCPAGSYGDVTQLSVPECRGLCNEGYFCRLGSTTPIANKCGAGKTNKSSVFCPEGSTSPQTVSKGHYSVPEVTCCKVCGDDSASCGDSCVPKTSPCTKPTGCACSKAEVAVEADWFCDGYSLSLGDDKWDPKQCNEKLDGKWVDDKGDSKPAIGYCVAGPANNFCIATCRHRCGFHDTGGDGSGTATGQSTCGPGYYCVQGLKHECGDISKYCPAGKKRNREENPP